MACLLHPGEEMITSTRPHARVLVGPIMVLMVLSALVGAGCAWVPLAYRPVGQQVIAAVCGLSAFVFVVLPVLRWVSTSTTLTTHRIIARSGWFRRANYDLPLNRVIDVGYSRRAGDLLFGSGTLLLTTVAGGRLRLDNLPRIKAMQQAVSELATEAAPQITSEPVWY